MTTVLFHLESLKLAIQICQHYILYDIKSCKMIENIISYHIHVLNSMMICQRHLILKRIQRHHRFSDKYILLTMNVVFISHVIAVMSLKVIVNEMCEIL